MSSSARDRIFARLHAVDMSNVRVPDFPVPSSENLTREEKVERLRRLMTAMRTEVFTTDAAGWSGRVAALAAERGWKNLLYGPESPIGADLENAWETAGGDCTLVGYTEPVESFKERLFSSIDAGITSTMGAVADTGAVILWPTSEEPRLMSLVPPVHIAVVDAGQIHGSLAEAMSAQRWSESLPTNALLISGPSKTADIEFTLVFGVHGPKEMIVIIRE